MKILAKILSNVGRLLVIAHNTPPLVGIVQNDIIRPIMVNLQFKERYFELVKIKSFIL